MKGPDIKINLLEPKRSWRISAVGAGIMLLLAVMGTVSGCFYLLQDRELASLQVENASLLEELEAYQNVNLSLQSLAVLEATTDRNAADVSKLQEQKISHVDIMETVNEIMPSAVSVAIVDINLPRVTISGVASKHSKVAELLTKTKSQPQWAGVVLVNSEIQLNHEIQFITEMEWEAGR